MEARSDLVSLKWRFCFLSAMILAPTRPPPSGPPSDKDSRTQPYAFG